MAFADLLSALALLIGAGSLLGAITWNGSTLAIPTAICLVALAVTDRVLYRPRNPNFQPVISFHLLGQRRPDA